MSLGDTVPFFASSMALYAAGIGVLGVILLGILKSHRWLVAGAVALCIIVITLVGFWPNGQWGISDWDYYFSYHTAIRRMVVEHGVFPQWNPYVCGGTSAIGDPEFPLFAPTFLLELLLGVPLGLRLAIFSVMSFGAIGMLLLAKRLKLPPEAGLLAAVAFSLGSINLLEIVEGHPNVFSAFYLPWIFWSWLGAYKETGPAFAGRSLLRQAKACHAGIRSFITSAAPAGRSLGRRLENERGEWGGKAPWTLLCGIFLALTFFQGGIYMLMYVGCAFLFLVAMLPNHGRALWVSGSAGVWALGLAAIKLIPAMLWLRQFPDKAYASSASFLGSLHKILLGRYPHGSENVILNQGSGWHEYGAYIGIIVLILALLSLAQFRRRLVRLLWAGALIAMLIASSGPWLKPLFDQTPFLPRSNISRLMILAVLPLSLLAGYGLTVIKTPAFLRRFAVVPAAILIGLATFDLSGYAAALSKQAFILQPVPHVAPPSPPIAFTINQHKVRVGGVDYTRAFAGAAAGYGTLSYCSVLGPEPAVRVVEDPEGSPYLSVPNGKGQAQLVSWSPNEVQVKASLAESGEVILNSNYAVGWLVEETAADQTLAARPAGEVRGRLAATGLPPGDHALTFTYQAPGLWPGILVTAAAALAAAGYLIVSLYNKVTQRRA